MSKILKFLLFFLGTTQLAWSQGQGNSPYSVLGIGELTDETTAAQDMMGGTGVSFSNTFYVNQLNPAMLVKNRSVGFTKYVAFCVGFKGGYKVLTQNGNIQENFGLNLNNLTMAFPIKPKWAMSVNIKPFSIADNVSVFEKAFTGANTVKNNYEYRIKGGLSRVSLTNSFQLAKGLYLGIEGQSTFGNILKDTTSSLSGSAEYFRNTSRINLKGSSVKTGLAYQYKLTKKWNINFGAVYQLGSTLKGENLSIFNVLASGGNGLTYIQVPDTLSIRKITTELPSKYKVGISLESFYHWVFAVDYGVTQWIGTKQFDPIAQKMFLDAKELNVGIEWLPNSSSAKYLDQVFYRIGFRQIATPYVINSTQIKDKSFSLGFSVPMGFRNPSYVDLGVSLGRRGVNAPGIIQENYTKISASFSLLSSWFNKPRID